MKGAWGVWVGWVYVFISGEMGGWGRGGGGAIDSKLK